MILPAERRRALTVKAQAYAGHVDQAMEYLLARGISKDVARMFSLGFVTEGDYAGRLTIPYVTPAGVVQIKFRCTELDHHDPETLKHINGDCPKYLYEAGTSTHLFNAQVLIHTGDQVVITEGELDAICVQAYCGLAAVGYPGVETWRKNPHWSLCFEGVNEVIVVADGNKVGKEAAKQVAESIGLSARVVEMPTGEDSNSFIATYGAGAYLERIAS